jgi:hypothetical protein
MKPRGNQQVKPQREANKVTEHSTDEGQQTPAKEVVLEPEEGNETPGNLEPENGEKPLQNLENSEPIVAHDEGLEAALNESGGEVIDAEFREVDEPEPAKPNVEALQAAYGSMKFPGPPSEVAVSMEIRGVPTNFRIGLQSDGSTKVIVTIQEGYWEAVQQWAESDGVPVEQWLSDRLYEYISTYGEPAKGR